MHEAKILHCEDSEGMREAVRLMLSASGLHSVVAQAETLGESMRRLDEIRNGELNANVVLLDGHLKGGMGMNHPQYIVEKARSLGLKLPIVGLSLEGLAQKGLVAGRDIAADLTKDEIGTDLDLLVRTMDKLPEPQ